VELLSNVHRVAIATAHNAQVVQDAGTMADSLIDCARDVSRASPKISYRDEALQMMLGALNLGVTVMLMRTLRVCLESR